MDFGENYRRLGSVDASQLVKRFAALPDSAWEEDTRLQEKISFRKETRSIFLIPDGGRFPKKTLPATPLGAALADDLEPVLAVIRRAYGERGYVTRVIATELAANAVIPDHSALPWMRFWFVHRIHLALTTSERVTFELGGETRHLPVGELWEINNTRRHTVHNPSPDPRVHLVIDYATPDLVRRHRRHRLKHRFKSLRWKVRRALGLAPPPRRGGERRKR